jgi:hypothetical protein
LRFRNCNQQRIAELRFMVQDATPGLLVCLVFVVTKFWALWKKLIELLERERERCFNTFLWFLNFSVLWIFFALEIDIKRHTHTGFLCIPTIWVFVSYCWEERVGKEWQGVWFLWMKEMTMEDRFLKLLMKKDSLTYSWDL